MWCRNPQTNFQIPANICYSITTYEDVRRSYPALKIPKDLEGQPEEAITAWWLENYGETVDLLHQVRWHRIVIDGELHLIFVDQKY